jgi:hypothetical protein
MEERFFTIGQSSRRVCSGLTLGVVLAISSATRVSHAEPADSDAQSHEKRAQVAYALQDWATAIREFEAAYQTDQKPDFLWGIAQAQRLSGDCKAAVNTYKSYRRSEVSADQSAAAESRIQHCQEELQKDPAEVAPTPKQRVTQPPPPPTAPPKAAAKAPPLERHVPSRPFYGDVFGDALVLTGVAAAGVGTYFLLTGNSHMHQAQSDTYSRYQSDTRRASREQLAGAATLAGGALFVVCGAVRFLTLGDSSSEQGAALTVSPLGFDLRGWF